MNLGYNLKSNCNFNKNICEGNCNFNNIQCPFSQEMYGNKNHIPYMKIRE